MRKRPAKRRLAAPAAAVPGAAVAAMRAAAMPSGAAITAQGSSLAPAALRLRSWLFVPGDSERKQDKALGTEADAVIFDLEDSVTAGQLAHARELVRRGADRSCGYGSTPRRAP